MISNQPLVTVGIPCFNAEETVARAVRSALWQTWQNIEVLIVDDASTDNSREVVQGMMACDERVKCFVMPENVGAGAVRERILEEANGEFVVFFDDDDESTPERIERQYERLSKYERSTGARRIVCFATGARVYGNNYVRPLPAIGSRPIVPVGENVADYLMFYARHTGVYYGAGTPACALMARLEVLRAIGGFDRNLRRVEDVDIAIRLALEGAHFVGCSEPLFLQYATGGADKTPDANVSSERQVVFKHRGYLQSKGRYEYALNWPLLRYYHFMGNHRMMLKTFLWIARRHPIAAPAHFLKTGAKRLRHESRMRGN